MIKKDTRVRRAKPKNEPGKSIKKRSLSARSKTPRVKNKVAARKKKEAGKTKSAPWLTQTRSDFSAANKQISKKIITKKPPKTAIDITPHYLLSQGTLHNYITLDWEHRNSILALKNAIAKYTEDKKAKRPFNVMLGAAPGSGKTHFIKCLTQDMYDYDIKPVTFNMACMESMNDLVQPLEEVRNAKVNDQLPLLFLDEFDSRNHQNYPVLLPLLWDGELKVGQRDLKVGKIIIVLAGSSPKLTETVESTKDMREEIGQVPDKLPDLLSRINGAEIEIPGLDEESTGRNRKVDKVCLAINLLEQRFGKKIDRLPWALLSFIAQTKFRYGVRSIFHLVFEISADSLKEKTLSIPDLGLPFSSDSDLRKSSLAYHMYAIDGASEVVRLWNDLAQHDASVLFASEQRLGYHEKTWNLLVEYFEHRIPRATK